MIEWHVVPEGFQLGDYEKVLSRHRTEREADKEARKQSVIRGEQCGVVRHWVPS